MRLAAALTAVARAHPLARKRLVCRRQGEGRELLRSLALDGLPWIGFETTTPFAFALDRVAAHLAAEGRSIIDEFDEAALIDAAFDEAIRDGPAARLALLGEGVGLRRDLADTIRGLRLAAVRPSDLRRARLRDEAKAAALAAVVAAYERGLSASRRVDAAEVFRRAAAAVAAEPPAGRVYLLPGLRRDGLAGQFLSALVAAGAAILPDEPVAGLDRPAKWLAAREPAGAPNARGHLHEPAAAPRGTEADIALFAAASVADEVREVLRRVVARELAWDEVEIVATDPVAYGVALDTVARPLGVPVTYAVGLPFERTRPGRVLHAYLAWIRDDFPDHVLRGLLEREDLVAIEASAVPGAALARRLRALRIGRGRARYGAALGRARRALQVAEQGDVRGDDHGEVGRSAGRLAHERRALEALHEIIESILDATPALPDRLRTSPVAVRPADLAHGLLTVLRFVPVGDGVDAAATARLVARLERIAATATRPAQLDAAIAVLLGQLETRVPAPDSGGPAPWSSAGGHVHLTDLAHGGLTGRRETFVVGLDAVRFPGGAGDDSLLTDEDRHRLAAIGRSGLSDTAERNAERRYALAVLLARVRGGLTLSYAAWDAVQVRTVPPAAELLQAYRLISREPLADYGALRAALGQPATAVPAGAARLDAADVWLGRLRGGGAARQGVGVVREAFPGLDRGLRAAAERATREFTAHHGRVVPRRVLDPRLTQEPLSASRLEALGTCPHRYMLKYVLRVYAPNDLELEPDRWLSHLDRGLLLHRVFERALRRARERGAESDAAMLESVALDVLAREVEEWQERVPPPGAAVFDIEVASLRQDVRAFARMATSAEGRWIDLERRFGRDGEPAVPLALPGGEIRVAGAIDRIDELHDGRLVIVDYKTGLWFGHDRDSGVYAGGRRLQHAVYAAAARALLGRDVARVEYHFASVRGENRRARYDAAEFADGLAVIQRLLDIAARGHFHPTPDPGDCRLCDYRVVCRVPDERFGRITSPAADWAAGVLHELEELDVLARLRGGAGGAAE